LDFHYDYSPRDTQRYWFKQQLALAEKVNLPVIIHSREASAETFDIISESNVRRGVIHCYSGAVPMALEYVKMGFHLGIGGVITFENAKTLADVVDVVPLESILLETDCPYLTPVPHRKQRNDSRFLPYVSQKIAGIKSVSQQEVELITANNASTLFQISIG
jgi:TatD DNase family protein